MPLIEVKDGQVTKVGLWHGTVIKMKDGKRFRVTKLNPVNVKIQDETGKGFTLNRAFAETIIDEDQSWDGPPEKTEYAMLMESINSGLFLGTAVKMVNPRYTSKYPDTYVVIAKRGDGTFRLAKLGGDGDRYLRNFVASDLEVVTV